MKKILVVCGNGIASSSIMVSVLQDYLKENDLQANVDKASISDCSADRFNSYDLIVSSTKLSNPNIKTKVIVGAGLLTGIGEDDIYDVVKAELVK